MKWVLNPLADVLKISDVYVDLRDQNQYQYAVLHSYPRGLVLEVKKTGARFKGKQHQIVQTGQFVISSVGMEQRQWGIVPSELDEAVIHRSVLCFDIHPRLNPNYFAAYLATHQFNEKVLDARTRGGKLDIRHFMAIKMPCPPPEDQQRIAEIWAYTLSALHHTMDAYKSITELKSDVAADLFRTLSSKWEPKRLGSLVTVGCDEDVLYPVYMAPDGQVYQDRPHISDVIGVRPSAEVDSQFLYYYLETQHYAPQFASRIAQHSPETVINGLEVVVPTLYEQRKIVTLLQQHDDALHKLAIEQNELQHLTQSIMELVFSGKLPSQEALTLLTTS